jgi:hypothetical protein
VTAEHAAEHAGDHPCDAPADDREVPLPGGGMGGAVRVGATVRRAAGPWTPAVQRLLGHLRSRGVAVPEPLGVDGRGRDVTGFVPGEVVHYPLPGWFWADEVLDSAARLLRVAHDATTDLVRDPALTAWTWRLPAHEPVEVVCHNDTSPDNLVVADGRVVAMIDWDTASPGPRVWDVAYLAYRLVPLGPAGADPDPGGPGTRGPDPDVRDPDVRDPDVRDPGERARRLRLLCAAYGDLDPAAVLPVVVRRLTELAAFTRDRADGDAELLRHAALYEDDARWVAASTAALLAP